MQGSAVAGGNGTRGEDVVFAGIHDKLSYSVGGFHFETDGFRENNDLNQDVANAFLQVRASHKTSVQAEMRSSDVEKGDLVLLFDPTAFNTSRQTERVNSARVGAAHAFDDRSTLLASLTYQDAKLAVDLPPVFAADTALDGYGLDLQHLLRRGAWQLTTGLSRSTLDIDETTAQGVPVPAVSSASRTAEQSSAYAYASLAVGNANVVLGGSFDSVKTLTVDDDWFSPKLGLFWNLTPATTLRIAAFRTTQGPFISRQNIQPRLEPTQVAGFNQFFYGTEGERAWRYGAALDHSFSANLFAGAEVSRRDIDFPFLDFTTLPPASITVDVAQDLARAYVNWVVNDRTGFAAEYRYERTDNDGQFLGEAFSELRTQRLPVRASYHHPKGFYATATATYVRQQGTFAAALPFLPPYEGRDSFWVLDASIGYRLRNRAGVVSVVMNNLLDEKFMFQDSDPENPEIFPERVILLKFTLAH